MAKVLILVEGFTEEAFVRDCLRPFFRKKNIDIIATLVRTSINKRGGLLSYHTQRVKVQLLKLLNDSSAACVTTMFDLFRLAPDFPGKNEIKEGKLNCYEKVKTIEDAFYNDINDHRFMPYIQLHEFEALLFSEPAKIASTQVEIAQLESIRQQFKTPEEINENNGPSKRIVKIMPNYNKVLNGKIIANSIGISKIRLECPHFDEWLKKLERLDTPRQPND